MCVLDMAVGLAGRANAVARKVRACSTVSGRISTRVRKRTVAFRLIRDGELRSVKIGRSRRVPADSIDAYVKRLLADQTPIEPCT